MFQEDGDSSPASPEKTASGSCSGLWEHWPSTRLATGEPADTRGELHPIKGSDDVKILSESDFDPRHISKSNDEELKSKIIFNELMETFFSVVP